MKSTYIIIAAFIIIVAGIFWSTTQSTHTPEKVEEQAHTTTTPVETSASENEQMHTEEDITVANDVGMEYPDMDIEVDVDAKIIEIDAFDYGYNTSEIRVKEGDTVTIRLTSTKGFHDWVVDEFDAATSKVRDGETTEVTFVANKKGTFEFYCSVGSHRSHGMVGKFIVE